MQLDHRTGGDRAGVERGLVGRRDLAGDGTGTGVALDGGARGGECGQVGGRRRPVPGDDRGADQHHGRADERQDGGQRDGPDGGRAALRALSPGRDVADTRATPAEVGDGRDGADT
ncbi:hypothetical protein O2W14_14425 [Modestobacter sp. VKM Ac-2986]|nr:hypothetical protein [Modestobacter sp. VKM Ac-2986]MCZ2830032.1 hypothetical protein [Modestobacter sp. VKM Ac-2986]